MEHYFVPYFLLISNSICWYNQALIHLLLEIRLNFSRIIINISMPYQLYALKRKWILQLCPEFI
jgi:hypothetical protein